MFLLKPRMIPDFPLIQVKNSLSLVSSEKINISNQIAQNA